MNHFPSFFQINVLFKIKMPQLFNSIGYLIDRRVDIVGMQLQIIQLGLLESNPTQFPIVMLQPF